jgi:hypothetical protein
MIRYKLTVISKFSHNPLADWKVKNMALLVSANERFELDVTVAAVDNNGVQYERTKTFEFNPGVTVYADAVAAAGVLLTALDAINEADIIKYAIRTIYDESTGAVTAVGNVRKEASLTLRIAASSKKENHKIFSPYDAMISGKSVVSTAALQTYLDLFETGGDFAISDGEVISTDEATRIAASAVTHVAGPKS